MTSRCLLLTLGLSLACMAPARAEDDWFSQQFNRTGALRPARQPKPAPIIARPAEGVPAPTPAQRPWHTIVVPAPVEIAPAARLARAVTEAPGHALKTLTGYAHELKGLASYYWEDQMTSSGERFNRHEMTAAHKTLPLGTRVRVTNLTNGKSTVVRINDRGPFKPGRIIDLSEAAAQAINMTGPGIARVSLDLVQ